MAFGSYFLGDSGAVQIDDNYKCLVCVQKSTYTFNWSSITLVAGTSENTAGNWRGIPTFTFTSINKQKPLLFLRPINCSSGIVQVTKTGNNYTWVVAILPDNYDYGNPPSNPSCSVNLYVFDTLPDTPSTSGWGLEIYNSSGHVVFNSNYPILNIKGTDVGNYTSGRTYAFYQPELIREAVDFGTDIIEINNSPDPPTYQNVSYYVWGYATWYISDGKVAIKHYSKYIDGDFNKPSSSTMTSPGGDSPSGNGYNIYFCSYPSGFLVADVTNI